MSIPNLYIRCTHTGQFPGGRPNNGSIYISDLDVGYEFQYRKVPCYVPRYEDPTKKSGYGHIDIPVSSRSLLSFDKGIIFKAVASGLMTAKLYLQPEVYDNASRPAAAGFPAGTAVWNTDDNALNWSDGAGNWRDATGSVT